MKLPTKILAWPLAAAMLVLRATCRVRLHADPRLQLRAESEPYVYAVMHAHQISMAINREHGTAAMVSRSADGDLLIPGFRALGIVPIRGSNRTTGKDRGGRLALDALILHVAGNSPALLAVDGPRGPRNRVRKGIAVLSQQSGAAVLNVIAVPSRRWILRKSWDRLQIPMPFCRIDAYFAAPLRSGSNEGVEPFRRRIEESLNELEAMWDPTEAATPNGAR